ncbi:hypothetical protein K2173_016222 [Erythroxylum novogranatense]|uniref:Uncharacterized protein n=1 Tax=Erythroxylum novogranatense TaxID=1862640 RepID=A0AAV8SFL8_9ROSI|nr:hypothetical protein K2173_016222 [Erythroxylum novogranatense]
MEANLLSSCHSCTIGASHFTLFLGFPRRTLEQNTTTLKPRTSLQLCPKQKPGQRFFVVAATEGSAKSSESDGTVPSWARLDSEEPPPWAREEGKEVSSKQNFEVPFFVYLLSSAVTAIAAVNFRLLCFVNCCLAGR